jgi:hypothetical protein
MAQLEKMGFVMVGNDCWRFDDDAGVTVCPVFTTDAARERFAKTGGLPADGVIEFWPISAALKTLLANFRIGTASYAVNPESRHRFVALEPAEFLAELIGAAYEDGVNDAHRFGVEPPFAPENLTGDLRNT